MQAFPTVNGIDAIRNFKDLGYRFIQSTSRELDSDVFAVRLLFKDVVCMTGAEAAKVFYDPLHFQRREAVPKRIQRTLLGEDGVQTLDGEAHRERKAMFMSMMDHDNVRKLLEQIANYWIMYIRRWEKMDSVNLFVETQEIFCRAACSWCGIPLDEEDVRDRTNDLVALVDAFGAIGPRHWRGRQARGRAEEWITTIIDRVTDGTYRPNERSVLDVFVRTFRSGTAGMDKHATAVEILNIVRPIVAISYYVTFCALALEDHPEWVSRLRKSKFADIEIFVQEVRRFYPFAPFTGAKVREDFEWNGFTFQKDTLVFLDLYGINHDPRIWQEPEMFHPERFRNWEGNPFTFVPQGGGDHHAGHRCAGERITIEAMKVSIRCLLDLMVFEVPPQDLTFSYTRLPTYPQSGFTLTNVRARDIATPLAAEMVVNAL
jgi:fatty-acid peroxygenase